MISFWVSFVSGIIFAVGLVISGMTNPHIVNGFLDVFGDWNPSLTFVMGGAILVGFFSFKWIHKRKPKFASSLYLPSKTKVDRKLLLGAALFGVGWGLGGICPGPGIVNLVTGQSQAILFVASMIAGMSAYKIINRHS